MFAVEGAAASADFADLSDSSRNTTHYLLVASKYPLDEGTLEQLRHLLPSTEISVLPVSGEPVATRSTVVPASAVKSSADLQQLTGRQLEILFLVLRGMSNKMIARHLYLSHFTVRNHLATILKTFGVHRRHELQKLLGGEPD